MVNEFFFALVFWWSAIDGDTIRVHAETFPQQAVYRRSVRLSRIDAPETDGPPCEKLLAAKATEWTKARLAAGTRITVKVDAALRETQQVDSFGRILGEVYVDGVNLSDAGLAAGVFRPYARPKVPWC